MSKAKPREFWVKYQSTIDTLPEINLYSASEIPNISAIHVIEYSRVTELETECNGLESLRREEQLMRHTAQDDLERVKAYLEQAVAFANEMGRSQGETEKSYKKIEQLLRDEAGYRLKLEAKLKVAEEALAKLGATK